MTRTALAVAPVTLGARVHLPGEPRGWAPRAAHDRTSPPPPTGARTTRGPWRAQEGLCEARKGRPEPLGTLGAHVDRASARRLGALCRERVAGPLARPAGPTSTRRAPRARFGPAQTRSDRSARARPSMPRPPPPQAAPGGANTGHGAGGVSTRAPSGLVVSGCDSASRETSVAYATPGKPRTARRRARARRRQPSVAGLPSGRADHRSRLHVELHARLVCVLG